MWLPNLVQFSHGVNSWVRCSSGNVLSLRLHIFNQHLPGRIEKEDKLGWKVGTTMLMDLLLPRKVRYLQLFCVEQKKSLISFFISVQWSLLFLSFQSNHQMMCMEPIWPYYHPTCTCQHLLATNSTLTTDCYVIWHTHTWSQEKCWNTIFIIVNQYPLNVI